MPMLTTLRMRLPVCPVQAPLRTRFEKTVIMSSTAWTSVTTSWPSTMIDVPRGARRATCRTARFSVWLIPVAAEHGVDALAQAGLFGQSAEQRDGLAGDAILRVVEIDAARLRRHALAPGGIVGKERAQVEGADLLVVSPEGFPGRTRGQ